MTKSRVFAFDCGVYNMGMCSIVAMPGWTFIERLYWCPLLDRSVKVTADSIIDAVLRYVSDLSSALGPPDFVLVEQQFISFGGRGGAQTNYHALEIQIALMTAFRQAFPLAVVKAVGASARSSQSTKERADVSGRTFAGIDSVQWNSYLLSLKEPQHVCDAITMALDELRFVNLPDLYATVKAWEQAHPTGRRKK